MNLLRLQLAASAIRDGLAKVKIGQTESGMFLIEKGLTCLLGLLAEVEAAERAA
jgi:hypothetical protein